MDEEERKFRLNFETAELAAAKFSSVKLMSANFQCGSRGGAVKQRTSLELRIANFSFLLIFEIADEQNRIHLTDHN